MFCQEGSDEEWDILFSRAQWGHLYWKHIKTVIEVSSKCPLFDSVAQITMRGRDESGVDWLGVRGTHGTDFMLLNYAKKLACNSLGSSPISSKKSVPVSAASTSPFLFVSAPVNAPRTCPNNSDSIRVGLRDWQSTATKVECFREPAFCTHPATRSF